MATEQKSRSLFLFLPSRAPHLGCAGLSSRPDENEPGRRAAPLFATPDDIAEGKELAQNSCVTCHGADGISVTAGVPNLAGQRPAYLYLEMKAYQSLFWDSGNRADAQMVESVKFLSDDALVKAAAYYASLDPAPPAETARRRSLIRSRPARPRRRPARHATGRRASPGCLGRRNLIGEDPQYLVAAMKDYKTGQRKNDTMKAMLAALGDADMNDIALFYALQEPGRAQTPAKGDVEAGKAAAAACAGCHGDRGSAEIPRLRTWRARMRRTSPARWQATRTRPAATRRWPLLRLRSTKPP